MANTFKVITHACNEQFSITPETLYTVPSSTTTVIIGLTLCNILTSSVLIDVRLESELVTHKWWNKC